MRRSFLPLIGLILVAAFFRLYHLGVPPFWGDEDLAAATQYSPVREIIAERLRRPNQCNIEPPGYHLVNQIGVLLVPEAEKGFGTESGRFRLRLVSALAGTISVLLLFGLSRRIFGYKDSWIPAVLLAFSFYGIYYSQENRPYALVVVLTLASTWLFVEAFFAGRRPLAVPYAVSAAALCWVHYTAILVPLIHGAAFLTALFGRMEIQLDDPDKSPGRLSGRDLAAFALAGIGALILFAPWIRQTFDMSLDPSSFFPPAQRIDEPAPGAVGWLILSCLAHWGCGGLKSLYTYGPLAVIGFVTVFRRSLPLGILLSAFYAVPLVYLFLSPFSFYIEPRYLIFIFPVHQLIVGFGLIHIVRWLRSRAGKGVALAIVLLVMAGLFIQNAAALRPYYGRGIKCDSVAERTFCRTYIELLHAD